jgi:biotin carboxyl carrier protein
MIFRYQSADKLYEIELERQANHCRVIFDGQIIEFDILEDQPGILCVREVASIARPVRMYWAADSSYKWVSLDGCTYKLEKPVSGQSKRNISRTQELQVRAPMPALVRHLAKSEGDIVDEGQTIMILEAMKMEMRIEAPHKGRISRLFVKMGQTVAKDELLVEVDGSETHEPDSEA